MNFSEVLSTLRAERGVYQKELADYLNMSIGTISNYEKGIHTPDFETLCKIADYYDVSIDYLLGCTQVRTRPEQFERALTENYTLADLMNTTLALDKNSVNSLVDYLGYLRSKTNNPVFDKENS